MKKHSVLALGVVVLSSAAPAQVSSPGGFLSTEGDASAPLFGWHADARYMFLDGERRGRATTIKER